MTDIFKVVRDTCDRSDCRLNPDSFGISNSAGHGLGWRCEECGRKWSVFTPTTWSSPAYDRNGKDLSPPPPEQKITEIS